MPKPTAGNRSAIWTTKNIVWESADGKLKFGIGAWDDNIEQTFKARKYVLNGDKFGGEYWTAEGVEIMDKTTLKFWTEFYYSPTKSVCGIPQHVTLENDKIIPRFFHKLRYVLVLAEETEFDKKTGEISAYEANEILKEIVGDLLAIFHQEFSKKYFEKKSAKKIHSFGPEKTKKYSPGFAD